MKRGTAPAVASLFTAACVAILLPTSQAFAERSGMALYVGPQGLGNGHPNPVTFAGLHEYRFSYVTDSQLEWNVALAGLTLGKRVPFKSGAHVTLGGGLLGSAHGYGGGLHSVFGYELFCLGLCLDVAFAQGIGVTFKGAPLSPWAVQIGVAGWFE